MQIISKSPSYGPTLMQPDRTCSVALPWIGESLDSISSSVSLEVWLLYLEIFAVWLGGQGSIIFGKLCHLIRAWPVTS